MAGRNLFAQQAQPQQVQPQQPRSEYRELTVEQLEALDRAAQYEAEAERIRQQGVELTSGEGFLTGIGAGMLNTARGIGNLLSPGQPFQDPDAEVYSRIKEANPVTTGVGEFVGEMAATAPIGGLAGGIAGRVAVNAATKAKLAEKGVKTARIVGAGTGEGAAVSAQLGDNILTGAALGGAAAGIMPHVLKAGGKAFQKLTGKTATHGVFDEATGELTEQAAKELRNAGIPIATFSDEVERLVKETYTPDIDLPAQVRQSQLEEFAPGAQARPSRLSQDYAAQNAEEMLIATGSQEGKNIVAAEKILQEKLQEGARKTLLGDLDTDLIVNFQTISNDANKGVFGQSIKNALNGIKAASDEKVSGLYKAARELAGGNMKVPADDLRFAFDTVLDEYLVDDTTAKKVAGLFKEYGIIKQGDELFDQTKIAATRKVQDLTLDNAEKMRQRLNQLDPRDGSPNSAFINIMRAKLDDQVDNMINQFPEDAAVSEAFKTARKASAEFKRTFNDKELIGKLIANKRGTEIAAIPEEKVLDTLLRSDMRSVQKLKQVMLEQPTKQSRQAWDEMRFTVIDEMLRNSINRNTGEISGQRLNNALASIGDERLKLLLGNEKFNQLKRFQNVISDQTIPIARLENPSGTGGVVTSMLSTLGELMRGSANVATGGVVESVGKTAKNRAAIEQAIKLSKGSIGRSATAKAVKARKQIADFFTELAIIGTVAGAGEEK